MSSRIARTSSSDLPAGSSTSQSTTVVGTYGHRAPQAVETVRLRYHSKQLRCALRDAPGGRLLLELDEPAHAIAPGQLACLMSDDVVVGYGTIGEPV